VRIRIMDFGLARGTNVSSLTKTGMLVGTMSYISPEQVMSGAIDGRSDIYSLGCVLYECVLNEVPFTGELQSVLYRVVHELPQSPRDFGAEIDQELEDVILACLAKDPAERPQKSGELARSLRRYRSKLHDSQRLQSIMMTQTMQAPRPALSPLIGREEEFKELQKRLNAAIQGKCQFVAVAGEPGVGKTRLLDELETLASARNILVLHGRFVEQHGEFPYHGFCEAIQEFYQRKERGSSPDALPDLTDLAADLISLFLPASRGRCGPLTRESHPGFRALGQDPDPARRRQAHRHDPGGSPRRRSLDRGPAVHRPPARPDVNSAGGDLPDNRSRQATPLE
jgi:hypothetical protein